MPRAHEAALRSGQGPTADAGGAADAARPSLPSRSAARCRVRAGEPQRPEAAQQLAVAAAHAAAARARGGGAAGATGTTRSGGTSTAGPRIRGSITTSAASATKAASRATFAHFTRPSSDSSLIPSIARRPREFAPLCYLRPLFMSDSQPTYDLMLLLDPAVADEQKSKILTDTEAAITGGGELIGKHDYGVRKTTYEVAKKKTEAHYHLMQFHSGSAELLASLNRTLHITDGVLRFRLIKLAPGIGSPPDLTARAQAAEEQAPPPPSFDESAEEPAPAA